MPSPPTHTVLVIWDLVLTLCSCLKMTGLKHFDGANPLLHPKIWNMK